MNFIVNDAFSGLNNLPVARGRALVEVRQCAVGNSRVVVFRICN